MSATLKNGAGILDVLAEMTLEEKATLVTGGSSFGTAPIERLGVPAAVLIDGGCGINLRQYLAQLLHTKKISGTPELSGEMGSLSRLVYIMEHLECPEELGEDERGVLEQFLAYLKTLVPSGDLPSCFPVNSLLASTWNPEIVRACARQVGKEASAFGVDMLLGTPCINIQRDPRGGRGFEGYSEDPMLISRLAPEYALGVQEQGVCADVKHFAANNQETNRQTINEMISERAMQEIYLPAFRACVQKGRVGSVMTAYNWINGQACAHNEQLIDGTLRAKWKFDGVVVSDWGGVYDQTAALKAGNDLCMPGPRDIAPIVNAVREGTLSEEKLNESVERILRMLVQMPVMRSRQEHDIDSEAARKVAYQAAAEGIILLKNDAKALPLRPDCTAAFYGAWKSRFIESGAGSGCVFTNKTSSLVDAVRGIVGEARVLADTATDETDAIVVTIAAFGTEGADRQDLKLDTKERAVLERAIRDAKQHTCKLIVLLNVAGPVELGEYLPDIDALLCMYFPGQEGAHAAADILYGRVNPSGKLAQTFPKHLYDCPAFGNFPGEYDQVCYGEGIFVGYRYYDSRHIEPEFPFGFGLSYTTFSLDELETDAVEFRVDEQEQWRCRVRVTNTGSVPGQEVVQLYLKDEVSSLPRPEKELKAFEKVRLEPGESKVVTLSVSKADLEFYDEKLGRFVCEPGWFTVQIGTSSRDLPLSTRMRAIGKNPYAFGADTQFSTIAKHPQARHELLRHLGPDILNEQELRKRTAYISFSYTLRDAWEQDLRPLAADASDADQRFEALCCALSEIDVTDLRNAYRETEIF